MKKSDLQAVNPFISNITSSQLQTNYYSQPTPEELLPATNSRRIITRNQLQTNYYPQPTPDELLPATNSRRII